MSALTVSMEDTLLIRARELRAMIEDPACENTARAGLTRGYFQLLRRLRERGVNFYEEGR